MQLCMVEAVWGPGASIIMNQLVPLPLVCRGRCLVLCVWCGVVWCGVVWCGVVWCGVVWCGTQLAASAGYVPGKRLTADERKQRKAELLEKVRGVGWGSL